MIKKYIDYAEAVKGHPDKEYKLHETVSVFLERIKKMMPHDFYCLIYKIHCLTYGPHFDETLAKSAVCDLKCGEHWTMDQTNNVADQHGIACKPDFYYTMNMLYSKHHHIFGDDTNTYVKMAISYMNNTDAEDGEPFRIWWAMEKQKYDND